MTPEETDFTERDFSLLLGGPLYQLYRRTHISGSALELWHRRIVVITLAAWLPLLLLTAFSGTATGGVQVPFFFDAESQVRFLVALPLLVGAELFVHRRLGLIVQQLTERRIVVGDELARFHAAIASTMKWRNSTIAEILLLVIVYTVGLSFWLTRFALETPTWYAFPEGDRMHLTPAGYWYILVSLPLFQFILIRWYYRLLLWFKFLYRVSRLRLRILPLHPDKTGGIGFLGASNWAFAPVLVAQGALAAGLMAGQIFQLGQELLDFKVQIAAFIGFCVIAMLAPLTVFFPVLASAKRRGLREAGGLATRYVAGFEEKWIKGDPPHQELLGSSDIQSLADLGNSMSFVQGMRFVPFGLHDVARFALIGALPFLPLTFTAFSLEDLLDRLLAVLF